MYIYNAMIQYTESKLALILCNAVKEFALYSVFIEFIYETIRQYFLAQHHASKQKENG